MRCGQREARRWGQTLHNSSVESVELKQTEMEMLTLTLRRYQWRRPPTVFHWAEVWTGRGKKVGSEFTSSIPGTYFRLG